MKTIAIALTLIIAIFIAVGFKATALSNKTEEGIIFFKGTWQAAIEKAKREHKLVFLDAYASWCGPCKMMKHKTFSDKAVAKFYNDNFINIAIDMEKGEGPILSNKFGVSAYPTLIYVNGEGKLIGKATGFHKPKAFLEMGYKIVKVK